MRLHSSQIGYLKVYIQFHEFFEKLKIPKTNNIYGKLLIFYDCWMSLVALGYPQPKYPPRRYPLGAQLVDGMGIVWKLKVGWDFLSTNLPL